MPEGHSIRIHRDRQNELLAGRVVEVSSPQKRFDGAKRVSGKRLREVEGLGKHLFYHFGRMRDEILVHVHLGRLGRFRHHEGAPPAPSPNCRMRLSTPAHTIDLSGPTRCAVISEDQRKSVLARLGPDPLRTDADPEKAWARIRTSKKSIGALLLDQSIIAGLGNIFRAEILFLLGLHPLVRGCDLTKKQFNAIWRESVRLLHDAVKFGWIITTTQKEIGKPLAKAEQADRFYVYRRQECRRCGSEIRKLTVAARTMFYCPKCQQSPRRVSEPR